MKMDVKIRFKTESSQSKKQMKEEMVHQGGHARVGPRSVTETVLLMLVVLLLLLFEILLTSISTLSRFTKPE